MKARNKAGAKQSVIRSMLEMTNAQARAFLLRPESYCGVDLPEYLQFGKLFSAVARELRGNTLASMSKKPRDHIGVNYSFLSNKDGRHAWRPFQLIHPALYVSLVEQITAKGNWKLIRQRFKELQAPPHTSCLSIPVRALQSRKDRAAQILQWWQGIEQASLELALEYGYVFHADVQDCYAAIYTHTIAWAIHGKEFARDNRKDKSLLGNRIDWHIQDMRHGQTNGIPQGSVLMDFLSELVLGYVDLELSSRVEAVRVVGYRILRYRDDYRIFVNNPQDGEAILKSLTEVLIELGLRLNTSKTTGSQLVVTSALKADKRAWLRGRQGDDNLQKHVLIIHAHGVDYPNSGSLVIALTQFHARVNKARRVQNTRALISIVVDIAYSSPRVFPVCAAIISKLLSVLPTTSERLDVIEKVHTKISQLPNTGHMEIWLQRISHSYDPDREFKEPLCQLVKGKSVTIWNDDWITSDKLKKALIPSAIVHKPKLRALKPIVSPKEIALFGSGTY